MDYIAWVDLETSGIKPVQDHVIYEIAVVVTDGDLRSHHLGPNLVIHQTKVPDNEYVFNMHTSSGLLQESLDSGITLEKAEREIYLFLENFGEPGTIPLAGSSVHFDRRYMEEYMPQVEAFFHYRNIDSSTLKEVAQRWWPVLEAGIPEKAEIHRAQADILESIELMRFFKNGLTPEHGFLNRLTG